MRPPAQRAAPILRGSRPGSSDLPTAQRFPLAAGEEACATCDRASNHVRLQRFTVRERCIPGLGESVGLVWPSDGPSDDRSPSRGRRDFKNHRDDDPRPLVVVRGLCRRCDLGVLACVGSADVCHSDPPRMTCGKKWAVADWRASPKWGTSTCAKLAASRLDGGHRGRVGVGAIVVFICSVAVMTICERPRSRT